MGAKEIAKIIYNISKLITTKTLAWHPPALSLKCCQMAFYGMSLIGASENIGVRQTEVRSEKDVKFVVRD